MGLGRLVISIILVWSAVAKLFNPSSTREAANALGVPRRFTRFIGVVLPVAEFVLAVGLLIAPVAVVAMVGATLLFSAFTLLVVVNLAKGRRPACHCFGATHSQPIGAATVVRNLLLTASSVVLVATHGALWGPDPLRWLAARGPGAVALAVTHFVVIAALAATSTLLLAVLRRHGQLLLRVEAIEVAIGTASVVRSGTHVAIAHQEAGLAVGETAPEFSLSALTGEVVSRTALLALGKPLVLVFTDSSCGPCHALLPTVGAWQRDPYMRATIAVMASGDLDIVRAAAAEHQLDTVLHESDPTIATAFKFQGTPCAVVVDIDGTVATPMASGAEAIRALVAKFTSVPVSVGPRDSPAAEFGSPAPSFRLSNIDGGELALDDLRGHKVVLLFWDPSCGFCQQLAPDLRILERGAPHGAPVLVLIGSGSSEENRVFGLASPILMDSQRRTMQAYGVNGTPIAVLVDEDGDIASALAVGGEAVLDLLRNTRASDHQQQHEESFP